MQQERAIREAFATGLGGGIDAFEGDRVTIVQRPEPNWGYVVNGVTFARGTLVAVAPELLEFARAKIPKQHREATTGAYLEPLRDEARRLGLGETRNAYSGSICWGLATVPELRSLPAGLRFEPVDSAWLNARIPEGPFENGAGPADGGGGRPFRNQYGVAVRDATDAVVALAGVFDTYGMREIGIDVLPGRQGEGLGRAAVAAAVHAILGREETPFYGCGAGNIRSQRTAWSSGFVPVCADASVV